MNAVFTTYKVASLLLYLFVSAILLQQARPVSHYVRFSALFFVAYVVGAFLFFQEVVLPLSPEARAVLPAFLATFGLVCALSWALLRQLSALQIVGVLGAWSVAVIAWILVVEHPDRVGEWIAIAAVLVLLVGIPGVLGYSLLQAGWGAQERWGSMLIFLAVMGGVITVIALTLGLGPIEPVVQNGFGQAKILIRELNPF